MDTTQRTYRFIPADVYTAGFRIVGKIMVSTNGIMGVLNDTTKSHLEIHDARLARIHMPTKLVDHYEIVRLVKAQVMMVCAARREDRRVPRPGGWRLVGPLGGYERRRQYGGHRRD